MQDLIINNCCVRVNKLDRFISLTDIWKAAGSPKYSAPKFWLRQDGVRRLIDYLKNKSYIDKSIEVTGNHLLFTTRHGIGTYAFKLSAETGSREIRVLTSVCL